MTLTRSVAIAAVLAGCGPTSLLELEAFVSAAALASADFPALAHIDLGEGQTPLAVSLCDWDPATDGFFRFELPDTQYARCPEPRTLRGALAPFPDTGASCNQGALLNLRFPEDDDTTWFGSGSLEVFTTGACSIIETHTLVIEAD